VATRTEQAAKDEKLNFVQSCQQIF